MDKEQAIARMGQILNRWKQIRESLPVQKTIVRIKGKTEETVDRLLDFNKLKPAEQAQLTKDFKELMEIMPSAGYKNTYTKAVYKQLGFTITLDGAPARWGKRKGEIISQVAEIRQSAARSKTILNQTDDLAKAIRVKPQLTLLGKVLKSGEIEKHHVLILKALEPFFKGKSRAVQLEVMRNLAKKGWFVGDINQNIAWINKWAHKLGSPGAYDSAHKYLRSLTDIEGRTISEASHITYKIPKRSTPLTIQNLEGIPSSAWPDDVKRILNSYKIYTKSDLGKLQKLRYQLASGKSYDLSVGYGFSREHLKALKATKDPNVLTKAALTYLDEAGAGDQMIGAVLMAVWNNPDVGDTEKIQMLADTPQNTRRFLDALNNATKPTSGPHARVSGNQANLSEITQSFKFQSAQPGLLQTPEGITMGGGVTAADEALEGLGKGLGQRMQDFDTARQLESVQNAAKWSEAWGGTGLKLGRKLGTLIPIDGVGLDAWDAVERHKHASREGATDLDKFQAWVAKFTLGSAAVPVYGQATNLAGGLLNLGIDATKFGYQYATDDEYREDTNENARALGGMTQDAMRKVLKIGQYGGAGLFF